MNAPIQLVVGAGGLALLVRGDDPAEIHRQAFEYAEVQDLTVEGYAAEVAVKSIRGVSWCGSACQGCSPDGDHYVTVRDDTEGAFRAALVACHVSTNEERAAREAAAAANRCETATTFFGVDLGRCHGRAVVEITFTCGYGCERAPQRVCAMHRDGAIATTKGTDDISVCRTCEQAGREDVPIRLLSCKALTTENQEVPR